MKDKRNQILKQFESLGLEESIELLSNVMIALSISHLEITKDLETLPLTLDEFMELLKLDSKANGENLANALGKQAINNILWLESLKDK